MSIIERPPVTSTPMYERMSATKKVGVVRELTQLLGARYVLHSTYDLPL